ncbi:glycogen synthase [Streptomyces jumonjinensis]|uniref:D-inositol 3-phosphate glycosyltransferase n=1 Tax=Streptomyces jumonjinensis TaxID=1945 RepID=A0A646KFH1_STRJU|nr:glycogen synthase [Streptomyces jumonjinensis]MQT00737.1 glycogen synthase [Streptomyces jumonjinensis]
MKVGLLTRDFPPDVTGGAGVHVEFLARELRTLADLEVHCWGDGEAEGVLRHRPAAGLAGADDALRALSVDLAMAAELAGRELVHSHTWYAGLAGHLAKLLYGVPHVMTAHSLESLHPWKAERAGGGYALSSWAERTAIEAADAVVTLSRRMREEVLAAYPALAPGRVRVIRGGVDTLVYRPDHETDARDRIGLDPRRPFVLFAGRTSRHKGLPHLLRAARTFDPEAQVVICAMPGGRMGTAGSQGEPDGIPGLLADLERLREGVHWIPRTLPRTQLVQLMTQAAVVVCPSVHEPLGMVNLEAMACGTAVVASAVGGIPEVVDDGATGLLVPYDADHPEEFEGGLAQAVNRVLDDPSEAARMGAAGRRRAVREFGWDQAAKRTYKLYEELLGRV